MVELVVRLVFSLAVIIGMLLLLARFSAKRFRGGTGAPIKVVHRQALSRSASVSVVTVGSRVLVLGTTEQQVQLLTELDPEELEVMDPALESSLDSPAPAVGAPAVAAPVSAPVSAPAPVAAPVPAPVPTVAAEAPAPAARRFEPSAFRPAKPQPVPADGPLAGSLLSAQTWKQALAAATGRGMDLS